MNIHFNPNVQNIFLNVDRINQNLNYNNTKNPQGAENHGNRDRAEISPMGKAASLIESLMEQKIKITDRKNELISDTHKNGGNISEIRAQIEHYDEQLESLEEQLNVAMTEQLPKSEKEEKKVEVDTDKPKSEEDIKTDKLNSVVELTNTLEQSKDLNAMKNSMENRVRTLEKQIELDKSKKGSSEVSSKSKEALIRRLEKSAGNIEKTISEVNKNVIDKVNEENKTTATIENKEPLEEKRINDTKIEKSIDEADMKSKEGEIDGNSI